MKLRNIYIGTSAAFYFSCSYFKLRRCIKNNDDELALEFMNSVCNKLIKKANIDLEVVGIENIRIKDNFLLISNHEGFFDLLYIMAQVDNIIGFVAKDSLSKVPIFSKWMKYYNCIFIDRNNLKAQVKSISTAAEVIKTKNSIGIMPEGTRSSTNTGFKPGSFKIASKSKAPIVGCTVINSAVAFEERTTNKRQKAKIIFHKPMYYEEYKDFKMNELAELFENKIYSLYEEKNDK